MKIENFLRLTIVLIILVPARAIAASLPAPLCTFPGCGKLPANVVGEVALPEIARIALNMTAALAVIFGIIGGARYLLSMGKDEETEKGKTTIIWAMLGMLVALGSHRIVISVLSQQYMTGADPLFELGNTAIGIMMALLNVVFFLMVFWGGVKMVMARGSDDEITKGRKTVIYAIVGTVIINVIPFVINAVIHIVI